ncbi:MAG: CPBP family intramembrane metalloprotease [Bacteroidetes bacterium]|nr:MAG: CPBP family intramembrane metalloprotease [Bacteroidota bacterium]
MDRPHRAPWPPDVREADASLEGPFVPKRGARRYLVAEFAVLFVGVPLLLVPFRQAFGRFVIPGLVLLGLGCAAVLWRDSRFDRRRLWCRPFGGAWLRRILRIWLIGGGLLAAGLVLWRPDLWLRFPREAPGLWLTILVTYPLLSAYPQEIIFRAFLFHRYRALFPGRRRRILVSGLVFGLAHLFFLNGPALVLSSLGGLLFARTYARSGAVLPAAVEHTLWGLLLFTVGLGRYFYGGAIGT